MMVEVSSDCFVNTDQVCIVKLVGEAVEILFSNGAGVRVTVNSGTPKDLFDHVVKTIKRGDEQND